MIQPGDVLVVILESVERQERAGVLVDARGSAHVPGLGDIQVGGLSLQAARQRVERQLRTLDRVGTAALRVQAPSGHTMTVIGAVSNPGMVDLTPGMRLSEVLAVAGPAPGLLADLGGARLIRDGDPLPIDIERAQAGDPAHDLLVQPGDLLQVPMASEPLVVFGMVGNPGAFPYQHGLRLSELLGTAGGLNPGADTDDVRLVRGSLDAPIVYSMDFDAFTRGERGDVALRPGDIVYVPEGNRTLLQQTVGVFTGVFAITITALIALTL